MDSEPTTPVFSTLYLNICILCYMDLLLPFGHVAPDQS